MAKHLLSLMATIAVFWTTVHEVNGLSLTENKAKQLKRQAEAKVYNGDRAKLVPFMVSLQKRAVGAEDFEHFCGATRITPNQLLTAANCFNNESATTQTQYRANLGTTARSGARGVRISFVFKNVTLHPQYNGSTATNDYAIITLPRNVRNASNLGMVQLATGKVTKINAGIAGWGDYNCRNLSPYLRYALGRTLGEIECKYWLTNYNIGPFNANRICAQFNSANGTEQGIGHGDSGGPLVAAKNDQLVQIGITSLGLSRGQNCLDTKSPQVFANIAAARTFIQSIAPSTQFTTLN